MKKFRVLMVALLSLVMCGGVFAGCGEKEATLKVAVFEGGYGAAHWDKIVEGFETANEGVKVELIKSSTLESEIRPMYLAGNGPDVVYLATNRQEKMTEQMLTDKFVHKLNGVLDKDVYGSNVKLKDRMVSKIMGTTATNPYNDAAADTYMLPLHVSGNGLFYNANLFYTGDTAVAGKYAIPESWEDFYALGEKLIEENKTATTKRYLFTYPTTGYMDSMLPSTIAAAAGVDKLNQLFKYEPLWEDAGVAKAMDKIAGLKKYIHPNTVAQANNNDFANNQKAVIDGTALFMPNGDWVIGEMAEYSAGKDMKWGMIPFMGFEDAAGKVGERFSYTNIEQIWISKTAEAKGVLDLAEKFLLYVYSDEALNMFAEFGNNAIVAANNYAAIAKGSKSKVDADVLSRNEALIDGTASPLSGNFLTPSKGVGNINWAGTLYDSINLLMKDELSKTDWIAKIISDAATLKKNL